MFVIVVVDKNGSTMSRIYSTQQENAQRMWNLLKDEKTTIFLSMHSNNEVEQMWCNDSL